MIAPFVRAYKVMRRNLQPTKPETPGQTPSLNDKCTGFFYVHYTTHGAYSFTSHPKDYGKVSCSRTQVQLPGIEPTFWFSDNTRT